MQSGYVTRQFIYLASEYYFNAGEDKENSGIILKGSEAIGRTKLDGSIVDKSDADNLVKVRSIVTSTLSSGVITGDMLPKMFDYKVGSRVGMSLISSLTEGLTQSGLALKHGGNLFNLDPDDALIAPEDGKLTLDEYWITFIGNSGQKYVYPKGNNFIQNYSANDTYKKNDRLGTNYHAVTPAYKLDSVIKLCLARTTNGTKSFSNNIKLTSECYAIKDGIIEYKLGADDLIHVYIGDEEYAYNPDVLYKLPNGSKVKKYDRICTGTLDIKSFMYKVTDYVELFYYFKKQFNELMEEISSELIEFLYILIARNEKDHVEIKSVMQNIHGSESFFKSLAFGDARKSFEKIGYEGMDFVADPITSVILSLIVNNEIK